MLSAVAVVLSYLESLIPTTAFMPVGVKAGFSNIATMFAASAMGFVPAMAITVIKALFAGITRGMTAMLMSFCGGALSTAAMFILFKYFKKMSYLLIGIISALTHNLGQLIACAVLVQSGSVIGYAPVLIISGIITGAITGSILKAVIPALLKINEKASFKGGN